LRALAPARRVREPARQEDMMARESGTAAPPVEQLSFEAALAELEQIVRTLEGGQGQLADAIAAYERGTLLRRHCESRLAEAEARVEAIVAGADGALATRPFGDPA
jgi:exodeoxyribonuclease VII small subunit